MRRVMVAASAALLLLLAIRTWGQSSSPATEDPVAELQRRIDTGQATLEFEADQGYLRSLLKNLNVPVASQGFVFTKSSFQLSLISPQTPRAIYFNDDVYVGFVQEGPVLELISIDPKTGPVFYTLDQEKSERPHFEQRTTECLSCHIDHLSMGPKGPVARLFVLSSLPNPDGNAINAAALSTTDQSPLRERWGGWYVTGTHGNQRHLGNILVRTPVPAKTDLKEYIGKMDLSAGANVTDLSNRFDTKPYLTPHSDIVALTLLAHQSHIHNLMTIINATVHDDSPAAVVRDAAEPFVRAMLFAWTPAFSEPITGTSGFAAEFSKEGPRDRQGRSLRELDLNRRLLKYPLSYLIYSKSFDELPASVRKYAYVRFQSVLTNQDQTMDFSHLSPTDRKAIFEILTDTKPEFRELTR